MSSARDKNTLAGQLGTQGKLGAMFSLIAVLGLLFIPPSDAQTDNVYHPDQINSVALTLLPSPVRWFDTRISGGPFGNGESRPYCFWSGQIPPGAKGILGNVVVVSPQSNGNLQMNTVDVWPPGSPSLINLIPAQDIANGFSSALDTSGCLWIRATVNGGGVHVVLDVYGYYQ